MPCSLHRVAAAAQRGVALEINANPSRLDLDDVHSRRAVELGIKLTINRDAHIPEDVGLLEFGVATARRGWVEAGSVTLCNEQGDQYLVFPRAARLAAAE